MKNEFFSRFALEGVLGNSLLLAAVAAQAVFGVVFADEMATGMGWGPGGFRG